jgi:cysteinyl-tRNA synthetase, unknown class
MSVLFRKKYSRRIVISCLILLIAGICSLSSGTALAQALTPLKEEIQGRVTIQGNVFEDVGPIEEDLVGPTVDFPEEMRLFIQTIAKNARRRNPNFVIVVENALGLLTKTDRVDEELAMPARTYSRSIDGVLEVGLFYGTPFYGKPYDEPKVQAVQLGFAKRAQNEALPVFVLDKADQPEAVNAGRQQSLERRYVYASIPSSEIETATLPDYPARPFDENPGSVMSLGSVKNYAVIGNSAAYGREDEYAMRMHKTNYDMLIVDVFHGRSPLSKQAVQTLKYKNTGAKRLVLARVNIGTAASYHYYWKSHWAPGSPMWIGAPLNQDPDRYFVEYWRPEWQRVITGGTQSFMYGIIAQGYDGVVLSDADVVDVFDAGGQSELQ